MSLFKYEVFVEVALCGSMSRAAEKLNQTVPGVSYTISKLEEEFGVPLLLRSRSRIELTDDAQRLIPHMVAVLNVNKRLEREIDAIKTETDGNVKVGSIIAVGQRWMPRLIRDFRGAYPEIEVDYVIQGYEKLFDMLVYGRIDLAIMVDPVNENISFKPFKRDRFYALFQADKIPESIEEKRQVALEELAGLPLIVPEWGPDKTINEYLEKATPWIRYAISDANTIISLVDNGLGVGIVSEIFLDHYPESITAIPIKDGPSRILGVAANSNLRPTSGSEIFQRFMMDWLAENRYSDIKNM